MNWEQVGDYEDIFYHKCGGIAKVTINRPHKRNAFRPKTVSEMYAAFLDAQNEFGDSPPRPPHWGGYYLHPRSIEFWQGGPNRLHDRFLYEKVEKQWIIT